ncbi:YunC family protein [Alteribacillus iranensis]|uniref:Uncharacterized protein YunC, DUF1805 family n=1 Tax=Alteribacillus iranensis TaxID=930128 RepID=A0A1I2EPL1_9BACI|nr:DUF1805 domain-containing protein [Alteribacillus iranensis]SFE94567.1 Uncharacterized protein YunC, DUF1805 family [Alteribacillus iranensis]
MMRMEPLLLQDKMFKCMTIELPETTLLIVSGSKGYIMCGALDIDVLNTKWPKRKIAAARALGVRTMEQLLDAPLESVTKAAEELGVVKGMSGREALLRMA